MYLPLVGPQTGAAATVAPYVILYLIPAGISAELALFGWLRRHVRAAMPFSLLMAAVLFWSACHAASVAGATFEETLFWAQIQYGGIVMVGPLWLVFALSYTGAWPRVRPALRRALPLPAALSYLAVLTNGWHRLWWPSVAIDASRPFGSLSITRGLLFWLHFCYSYGCILLGCALFIRALGALPPAQRRQARLMAVGALLPLAGNLAHLLGLHTAAVDDPTPFLFTVSGLLLFYVALRYQFLDPTPIAQHDLFASIPDGLVVLDRHGMVTAHNDPAPAMLASRANRWVGWPLLGAVAGSPLEIDLHALLAPPAGPTARTIAYEGQGGLRAVELRLRPLYAAGERTGALLVVRDRTERARIELALDRRLGELNALSRLARAANAALETEDLVRAITRELAHALPGDRAALGLLHEGGAAMRLVAVERLDAAVGLDGKTVAGADLELLQRVLRAGRARVCRVSDPALEGTAAQALLRRAGLLSVAVVPLRSRSEALGVLFVGHAGDHAIAPDELRMFETVGDLMAEAVVRTRLYDQGQAAVRARSALLARVSHELRTPLTSIMGFTELIQRGFYGELPERMHDPLGHVRRNSQTLLRLINDILDFSKIEAGHFSVELSSVDLAAVIHDVAGALQPQIQERGLALMLDLAESPPVYANRERLEQVLTNLVANAIKFTDHGSITIRTTFDGQRAHFSVIDTGIGIAPEQQRKMFQEFWQVESEHTQRYPSTGLGLAISRRLMEMMGGTLTVESTPGVGSTFSGDVPAVSDSLQAQQRGRS
jgi:signal transduction histidine kinase/PAS domain-containing protein